MQVSGTNPNVCPICEELQGKYLKDFKWVGWHPHCRCHAVPILEKPENFKARMEALRRGDRVPPIGSVKELPANFTAHLTANHDRITASSSLPYFVRDNYLKNADGSLFPLFGYPTNASKLKAFKKKAQELLQGKTFRDGITISNKSIKEWLNQPHRAREAKDKWIFNIGQMLKNSTYLGQGVDKFGEDITVHLYETTIGTTTSWVVVREFPWGKQLHSISDNESILQHIKAP